MTTVIGFSGRKQSGKNTGCNIIAGEILSRKSIIADGPLIDYYKINKEGQLEVPAQISEDKVADGPLNLQQLDPSFIRWASEWVFPHVKVYSFAEELKKAAVYFFNISPELVFGNDEQKNGFTKIPRSVLKKFGLKRKIGAEEPEFLTGREFLQFLGTDVFREIYEDVWVDLLMRVIQNEKSEVALVSDVRFESEVLAIQKAGGKVVRLLRNTEQSDHKSETALDNFTGFDHTVDNVSLSIEEFQKEIVDYASQLGVIP